MEFEQQFDSETKKIISVIQNHVRKSHLFIIILLGLWISMLLFLNNENNSPRPFPQSSYILSNNVSLFDFDDYDYYDRNNQSFLFESNQISQYVQLPPYNVHGFQVILFWTPYFSTDPMIDMKKLIDKNNLQWLLYRPKYCFGKYPKCLVTNDRSYQKLAKAMIFHWIDVKEDDLPERNPNQSWVLYNMESPANTPRMVENNPRLIFNYTSTYRSDSDLVVTYGKMIKRRKPIEIDLDNSIELRYKTKPIVWFVSHCETQGRREIYVHKLSKFLQVDIYGKCGKFQCPRDQKEECYRKASKEYLFYLSFENSICKDYVTEKLFNVMQYDIVPIVYGGADYESIMPSGSYIDANKLKPKKLAELLVKIASDRKLYLSYFEWRKTYFVSPTNDLNHQLYCEICKELSKGENNRKTAISATKINHWFFGDGCAESKY